MDTWILRSTPITWEKFGLVQFTGSGAEWIIVTHKWHGAVYDDYLPLMHRHARRCGWVYRGTKKCEACDKQVPEEILAMASLILMQDIE
mgnify:CR=1 FL=1